VSSAFPPLVPQGRSQFSVSTTFKFVRDQFNKVFIARSQQQSYYSAEQYVKIARSRTRKLLNFIRKILDL
jgi:hypothetical protein